MIQRQQAQGRIVKEKEEAQQKIWPKVKNVSPDFFKPRL
jgi:hypothetical protein